MSRRRRVFVPGLSQHVVQRGNNRCIIFRTPSDYRFFLSLLQHSSRKYKAEVHGYVLMTNHVHFLVTPSDAYSLPRMMQGIGRLYVPFYNRRYGRTGTLWEHRYDASLLHDDAYWLTCLRYVELNPVRAGLTDSPEKYPWSSYRAHAFGREDPILPTRHPLYVQLGGTDRDRQEAWRSVCAAQIPEHDLDRIRRAIHSGQG
jgi:putative transposase